MMKKADELRLKLMLTLARDRQAMQGRIRSVGFMREYLTLPEHLGVHTLTQMSDEQIEALALSVYIKEKSEAAHFHVYLNDIRYRLIKSEQQKIALISSASIEQFKLILSHAGISDEGVVQILLSSEGVVPLSTMNLSQIKELIYYILFVGTERGPALHEADGLFVFEDAMNMNSWTLLTKEQAPAIAKSYGYFDVDVKNNECSISLYCEVGIINTVS